MSYDILVTDMDGTLLNEKGFVSHENFKYIKAAEKNGVRIILATGRIHGSAYSFARELGLKDPIISSNGALVSDEDRVIYENTLNIDKIMSISKIARKFGSYYHFYADNKVYVSEFYDDILSFYRNKNGEYQVEVEVIEDLEDLILNKKIDPLKVLFLESDQEKRSRVKEELSSIDDLYITTSWADNIEVMNKGVSKGVALKKLMKELRLEGKKVIAIGDNENDIPMLEYSDLGVAMGNGVEAIKEVADYVTGSNTEDGLAQVIKKYIL